MADEAVEQVAEQPSETVEESELKRARSEAARYRKERNETRDQISQILDALKINPDVDTTDPAKLADYLRAEKRERAKAERELKELKTTQLLREVTEEQGVNFKLTSALLKSEGRLKNIDLDDLDGARQDLADLVTDAVRIEPTLAKDPGVPAASGPAVQPGAAVRPDGSRNPSDMVDELWSRGEYSKILELHRDGTLGTADTTGSRGFVPNQIPTRIGVN